MTLTATTTMLMTTIQRKTMNWEDVKKSKSWERAGSSGRENDKNK